jgi:hypothetical protein
MGLAQLNIHSHKNTVSSVPYTIPKRTLHVDQRTSPFTKAVGENSGIKGNHKLLKKLNRE